ncbi:MAG: ABC transporter ATP-binding protein [Treponema sp.]|jgi:oligopeptide/dipeptide ABC transporter ATP-binding protein|nr:ABC transporter ATP-binding protein [Treponema sp.]
MDLLEVRGLTKAFPLNGGRRLTAVNSVSLRVGQNRILGIVGESGCGKSTLGRLMLRLIAPTAGQVFFRGREIGALGRRALLPFRRAMQMVFQNPFASFNPKMRIAGALMEVCRYYGMTRAAGRERVEGLFEDIGLPRELLARWPRELSGGQLQRLAIARALLSDPALIVADEPLSALDVSVQAQLLNLLENLRKTRGTAMVFISHDMTVVEYLCDAVAVMYLGSIMELAPAGELFDNTLHPYTRSLKEAVPRLETGLRGHEKYGFSHGPSADAEKRRFSAGRFGTAEPHCPFAPRCGEAAPRCRAEAPFLREISSGHFVSCHRV